MYAQDNSKENCQKVTIANHANPFIAIAHDDDGALLRMAYKLPMLLEIQSTLSDDTPAHYAVKKEAINCLKVIINQSSSPENLAKRLLAENRDNETVLSLAKKSSNEKIAQWAQGVRITLAQQNPL